MNFILNTALLPLSQASTSSCCERGLNLMIDESIICLMTEKEKTYLKPFLLFVTFYMGNPVQILIIEEGFFYILHIHFSRGAKLGTKRLS